MSFTGLGITEEMLSPNLAGPLELLLSPIEAGYVIASALDLWVSGRHFRLNEGDNFSFKGTEMHRCANPGKSTT